MDDSREVILKVHADVNDALKNIIALQKQNEALKSSIKSDSQELKELQDRTRSAGAATAEQTAQEDALRTAIINKTQHVKANTAAINGNTKAVDLSISTAEQKAGSLIQLRKEAAILTQRYSEMSREEREVAKAGDFGKHLKDVNDEIREATLAIGNYKDNIGNYQSALTSVITDTTGFGKALKVLGVDLNAVGGGVGGLKSGFAAAAGGAANLGKAFTALAANPFVATVSVIVGLVLSLKKAIDDNATANAAWNTTLKALDPVLKLIQKAIGAIGTLMVSVVNSITEGLQALAQGVGKVIDWFGDLIGVETHAEEAVKKYTKTVKEAAELENQIAEKEQTIGRDRAKMAMEVADLRVKAEDKVNYSVKERLNFLDAAIKKEQEAADASEQLAALKLKRAQQELSQNKESLSAQQAVYDSEAEYYQAQKERGDKYRELQAQRITFLDEEKTKIKEAQAAAKVMADTAAAGAAELRKLREEFNAETAAVTEQAEALDLTNQLKAIELRAAAVQAQFDKEHSLRAATVEETQALYDELNALDDQRTQVLTQQEEVRYQSQVNANLARQADTSALLQMDEQLQAEHELNLLAIQADAAANRRTLQAEDMAAQAEQLQGFTGQYADLWKQYYSDVEQYGADSSQAQMSLQALQAKAAEDTLKQMGSSLMEFNGTNKAAFEAGKAISIATATVDTYKAANSAYSSLAGIPLVGPALGAAAAAAAIASGFMKVKKIKSTKWQGGGSSSSSSAATTAATSSATSSASSAAATTAATSSAETTKAVKYYDYSSLDTASAASAAGRAASSLSSASSAAATATESTKYATREDMVAAIAAQPAPIVAVKDIADSSADYERRQTQITIGN